MIICMPQLEPIPIPTKGKPLWARIWALLTVVRTWKVTGKGVILLPDGTIIVIPVGFVFDGASIPKPLWWLLSPVDLLLIPGLIHDFGYRYNYLWAVDRSGNYYKYQQGAGQEYFDSLFCDVGIAVNGMILVDKLARLSLKIAGFSAWNKNRKLNESDITPA